MIFKPIKNQKLTTVYDPNKLCYCFNWTKRYDTR